jgi:hypothetical protein
MALAIKTWPSHFGPVLKQFVSDKCAEDWDSMQSNYKKLQNRFNATPSTANKDVCDKAHTAAVDFLQSKGIKAEDGAASAKKALLAKVKITAARGHSQQISQLAGQIATLATTQRQHLDEAAATLSDLPAGSSADGITGCTVAAAAEAEQQRITSLAKLAFPGAPFQSHSPAVIRALGEIASAIHAGKVTESITENFASFVIERQANLDYEPGATPLSTASSAVLSKICRLLGKPLPGYGLTGLQKARAEIDQCSGSERLRATLMRCSESILDCQFLRDSRETLVGPGSLVQQRALPCFVDRPVVFHQLQGDAVQREVACRIRYSNGTYKTVALSSLTVLARVQVEFTSHAPVHWELPENFGRENATCFLKAGEVVSALQQRNRAMPSTDAACRDALYQALCDECETHTATQIGLMVASPIPDAAPCSAELPVATSEAVPNTAEV